MKMLKHVTMQRGWLIKIGKQHRTLDSQMMKQKTTLTM